MQMISRRLVLVLYLAQWLVTSHAIRTFTASQGLRINDFAFTMADSIEIDIDQPIQAIRIGIMIAHGWPEDLELHLLPPWSEWRGPINGSYNGTASDLLTFSPLSTSITLLRHVKMAGSNSLKYLGNVTANEMFWFTSSVDPMWSGAEVSEFKGSKQASVTGVFLPSDGDYPALGFYQQNKMRRLIGRSALGTWRLLMADSQLVDDGLLFRWSIEIAYCGDGVLLPLVEQCDGTQYCDADCRCPVGCISSYEGTCDCPGPIIATTENIGLSEFPLDDIYRTMPTDDGDAHVTFFLNMTTNELTAQIIDSDNDTDAMTRVIAINSTFLDATATSEGFAMLRINSVNGDTEIIYMSIGIENEDSTTFTVNTFNSSVTGISGMILPNGVDDNFAICVSHVMGQYTTDCILTDPEGAERITTSWTTDYDTTSPPALLLSNEVLLQVFVKDNILWRRTVLVSDRVVNAPVQLYGLASNSDTVQLTLTRNTNGEATVSVVQGNGAISILKIKLSNVKVLTVISESVTEADHVIVTNLDDNTSLAVYSSNNGSVLSTRLLSNTSVTQSVAVGFNIQPDSALPLSRKRFLVTWAESSQKRQVPGSANLVYSTFTTCGNGVAEPPKDCDGGPHCNQFCSCENGFYPTNPISTGCVSQCGDGIPVADEECDGGLYCTNCTCNFGYSPAPTPSAFCTPICGDGIVVVGESCDYLNDTSCDTTCKCKYGTIAINGKCAPSSCGDLYLDLNFEVCDGGAGCDSNCFCKSNYVPTVPPSVACVPVQPTYAPGWSYYPPSGDDNDGGFFETFGFISIILFVLFMVMLAGCVAGTIALTVIVLRRRQARRRQQFFNQNIEMEPKTSMPAPVEPESGAEPVPQTPTSPKKSDVEKDLNFGDMTDR